MSRREKIESMLQDQPDDPFLRYTLAMEMEKTDEHDEALAMYRQLTSDQTPYVPAFFMAGQMLARLDRTDEAKSFLEQGIEAAQSQQDLHAAEEMREFLAMMED